MSDIHCTTCDRALDACIDDPNAPCGAPAQQRAYEEAKRLEAEIESWKRKEADAYHKGVTEAIDHVRTHIENMCTWSTSQSDMQKLLLRWIDEGASGRVSPHAKEQP